MNIYETVTERILTKLEQGVIPWRKTWTSGLPKSLASGKEYRGMNILLLGTAGFTSRYWITFREALRLGGHVRLGEKGTTVFFWHWRTAEDLEKLRQKTGRENLAPCTNFASVVFNLDQVDGIARPDDDTHQHEQLDLAENVFQMMPNKPEIVHSREDRACYNRARDLVTLPHLGQFESAAEYFATLYHELTHATAHEKRLNRAAEQIDGNAPERYSFEELVAEFGSAFLCGFAGISNPVSESLQAGYIQGWAEVIRKDTHLIVRAASAAQRAADYIRGKVVLQEAKAAA